MEQQNNLANVGLNVNVDLTTRSVIYLLAVIALGSVAFFVCKKFIV